MSAMTETSLKQARALLRSNTDWIIRQTLPRFSDHPEILKAMHHCEKMGKARGKVIKAINHQLSPISHP